MLTKADNNISTNTLITLIAAQGFDEAVNMANWDSLFYTRTFPSMDSDRSMRHVSKLLTYPLTIASVLHQSSPHKYGEQVTSEGMRSIAGTCF